MIPKVNLSNVLLLVAEDDMANFYLINELLSSSGIKILHAWDGEEAVSLFKANPGLDVILMDIRMPRMDGYEATTEIRRMDNHVAIIAQTGYVFEEDKQKARSLGFNDYLCKPLNEEELISVIVRHVEKKKILKK
jgi:CheY-like chemotaxis protein